jgi:hypothetical protein
MKVYSVNTVSQMTYKGGLDKKTADMLREMNAGWFHKATEMKTQLMTNTCLFASERINNVFINLSIMMERFGHACNMTYEK